MTDPQRPKTTPEGHTPEEPRPSEMGKAGTPGAGMTPDVPHAADARQVEEGEAPARGEAVGEAHNAPAADAHGVPPVTTAEAHAAATDHAADGQMDAHATLNDNDHAHAEPRVGPIDWPAWGFALIGVLAGLLVVALFFVAVGGQLG